MLCLCPNVLGFLTRERRESTDAWRDRGHVETYPVANLVEYLLGPFGSRARRVPVVALTHRPSLPQSERMLCASVGLVWVVTVCA